MKWAWLLAMILAALAVIYSLASVDFAAGQSLEDTVRESEVGRMPSQEEFSKRSAPTPGRWKAVIRYHEGLTATIPNVADCDAAMQKYAGPGKTVTCEREEEFSRREDESHEGHDPLKEGESDQSLPAVRPDGAMPDTRPDSTPPRAPDAGGPGRVVPEERRLSAWAFGVWSLDGDLRSGGMFADQDECLVERMRGQSRYRMLIFGPCVEITHGKETL